MKLKVFVLRTADTATNREKRCRRKRIVGRLRFIHKLDIVHEQDFFLYTQNNMTHVH